MLTGIWKLFVSYHSFNNVAYDMYFIDEIKILKINNNMYPKLTT